ncbi:MAG: hypothetical protein NTX56_07655 [Proteobacteria bacterium]|nr:hypothetical protein [Pseudomonadota bacterium]
MQFQALVDTVALDPRGLGMEDEDEGPDDLEEEYAEENPANSHGAPDQTADIVTLAAAA